MNVNSIAPGQALRILVRNTPITKRMPYEEICKGGRTPYEYVNEILSDIEVSCCTLQLFGRNGSSYVLLYQFWHFACLPPFPLAYPLPPQENNPAPITNEMMFKKLTEIEHLLKTPKNKKNNK